MDVTIASGTARAPWVGGIGHVEEDQSTAAGKIASDSDGLITTNRSSSNRVVELLVHDNVVGAADWELIPVARKVILREVGRVCRVKGKELLHVEDLDTVVDRFGTNDSIVAQNSNLSPIGADRVILRETA